MSVNYSGGYDWWGDDEDFETFEEREQREHRQRMAAHARRSAMAPKFPKGTYIPKALERNKRKVTP